MATYTRYNYATPYDDYKHYMPSYTRYNYTRPNDTYRDSDSPYANDIAAAQRRLDDIEQNKPGQYQSQYNSRINALIDELAHRRFTYDLNGDALYKQYKDQYTDLGKQAMRDTMAQAAAATGGYGNSYAASVGNQAYQSYLNQINDKIPELYQLALDRYNTEGNEKQNLYSIYANQEAQDYGKYRDRVGDYQTDRGYYDQQLQNLRTMGQNLWGQNWSNYWNAADRTDSNWANAMNMGMQAYENDWNNYHWAQEQTQHNYEQAVAEDQWAANLAEQQRQHNENLAYNYYNSRQAQAASSNRQSAGGGSDSKADDKDNFSTERIKDFKLGLMSRAQLYGRRGNNHGYSSYEAYVEAMLDKNNDLTLAERAYILDELYKNK